MEGMEFTAGSAKKERKELKTFGGYFVSQVFFGDSRVRVAVAMNPNRRRYFFSCARNFW